MSNDTAEKGKDEPINWLAEIRGLILMLLAVIAFHTFVAKTFYIPSVSMVPNLMVGDRLVVSKWPYGWSWVSLSFHVLPRDDWRIAPGTPEYGDIVIVVPPNSTQDYIKRVVALPGDTIALVDGRIILNGKPIKREMEVPVRLLVQTDNDCVGFAGVRAACLDDFAAHRVVLENGSAVYEPPTFRETLPNGASYLVIDHQDQVFDNMTPLEVPEGHIFLMGDNRDHSADSRAPAGYGGVGLGGPVPIANIGGRAERVTFSLDGTATYNPFTWWEALRPQRAWRNLRPEIRGDVE